MKTIAALAAGLLAALSLAGCGKSGAGGSAAMTDADMSLGNPNAKVTMVEYASITCPHCGTWEKEVWPAFKAKYVDTGKVKYVFREFLIHPEVDAAGYLLARCAGKDKYFPTIQAIFAAQPELFQTGDAHGILLRIAKANGMSEAQFNTCVTNEQALKALAARQQTYEQTDKVNSTPTFFVNGKEVANGEAPLATLDAAIQPLLK